MSTIGLHLGVESGRPTSRGGGRGVSAAGLLILIPGCLQWSWRQRGRGSVLLGSYLVALGVGLFAWGTPVGLLVLGFAFGTHVASTADVVRQRAFPGFGRWVPMLSACGGLGLGLYAPALVLATLVAWPGMDVGAARDGYLVNCRAYRHGAPRSGDWVWLRSSPWGEGRLGRVVAGPGQEVEWSDEELRVDGRPPVAADRPWSAPSFPGEMALTVPDGHALIVPAVATSSASASASGPVLVPQGRILGRAWACLYPIRRRRILP